MFDSMNVLLLRSLSMMLLSNDYDFSLKVSFFKSSDVGADAVVLVFFTVQ